MAFVNLFTSLSAVEEDVKSPGQPAFTHRNKSENGKRNNAKKRKPQDEQTAPYTKKRCHPEEKMETYNPASFVYSDWKTINGHVQNTASENGGFTFSKREMHNHSGRSGHSGLFSKGPNFRAKYNNNANKQHQQRKKEQKNQHQLKHSQRNANRNGHHEARRTSGRGGRDYKHKVQDFQDKPRRLMTQEFLDQNAVIAGGRLLCRHFISGRCIKGDDCQLEHVQGSNDLLKEVCKFYVQGFCSKGESCPYMHKSFPCKFFHRTGNCYQGADCRFSHEPLSEVTTRLLEETIKRDNELYELAKKTQQTSSEQAEEADVTDTNTSFDLPIQPLRPNFYNSEATNAEQEVLPCQAEELPNDTDQAQPHSPPSAEPIPEEPVCYSVEAVLGRQLFKPFHSFCKTPQVQESTSSSSVNQSEVPYSVDALLRSWKSAENSTPVHTPTAPAAQSVPYAPKTDGAALHPEIQKEGVCCSVRARNEQTNKSHENIVKSLLPRNMHTDPIPKTSPDLTLVSGSHKKRAVEEALKPALRAPHEAQSELLCYPVTAAETSSRIKGTNITNSVNSKEESHPPVTPSTCKASVKPPCPPAGFSESKRRAAVSPERVTHSGNSVIRQLKAEQPAENQPHCSSESSVGCEKTRKRPFHSLFAKLITGSMKPATDSALSMCCTSKDLTTRSAAERAGASTGSFLSLFSAPLLTAPQPQPADSWTATGSQESNHTSDHISHPSDSLQLKIDGNPLTTGPKRELDGLSECGEQQRNPTGVWPDSLSQTPPSPPPCANSPDQAQQQQQLLSSHKGSSAAAAASGPSVLKTLFLRLSPYRHDGEQHGGSDEDKNSTIFEKRCKKKVGQREKMKAQDHQQCSEKSAAHSTEHHPTFPTPQISSEASAVCSPGPPERHAPTHSAYHPKRQQHRRSIALRRGREGKWVRGNTATPLQDLFKTLDTTVFHVGR